MKSWQLFLAGAALCGGLSTASVAAEVPRVMMPARFFRDDGLYGTSFSADESRLLPQRQDAGGTFNACTNRVGGGPMEKLTRSTKSAIFGVSYFPKDNRILYTQDEGGNELNHLYVLETNGKARDLTPGRKVKAMFMGWSGDLSHFYAATNERDPQYFDLYRYHAGNYERTLVFKNTAGYMPEAVSRNGRWLALVKAHTNADNDLFLWDAETPAKEPVKITPHQRDVEYAIETFSPGRARFRQQPGQRVPEDLCYDLKTGERKPTVEDRWDVLSIGFSWQGRYRVVSVNADARTVTTVTDLKSGQRIALPKLTRPGRRQRYLCPQREPAGLLRGRRRVAPRPVRLRPAERPTPQAHHQSPAQDQGGIPGQLGGRALPQLRWPEDSGPPYKPHGASPEHKAPALVWVHGGPGGQCRVGYNPDIQFLVNHGYAVLALNNRGSSGYGKTYFHMDDRKHGEVDLKDVVYGRRYLESLDWVDGRHVGILGGSYGGYMVCAALAFEPEAFDVGIDIFGVTNWLRTLESIPPWWASFRDALYAEMGDPKTDRERLRRISPLFHAKNIRKPLLVVQGAERPARAQDRERRNGAGRAHQGVPVEYIVFPDEGHGFLKKENRITAAEAYLKFLDRYLAGKK